MIVEIQSKGAEINTLLLSEFENYDDLPIPMIKNENSKFNVSLYTRDGRVLNTRDFYFKTSISEKDDEFVVSLKSSISKSMYVVYEYIYFQKTDICLKSILNLLAWNHYLIIISHRK